MSDFKKVPRTKLFTMHLFIFTLYYFSVLCTVTYTYKDIYEVVKSHFQTELDVQISLLEKHWNQKRKVPFKIHLDAIPSLKKLLCKFKTKWKESYRNEKKFLEKNEGWLNISTTIAVSTA